MYTKSILCVESGNNATRTLTKWFYQRFPVGVFHTSSLEDARRHISSRPFDLIVLDYCYEDGTGVEFLRELRARKINVPVVFFSVLTRDVDRQMAIAAGCSAYLSKPEDEAKLGPLLCEKLGLNAMPPPIQPKLRYAGIY